MPRQMARHGAIECAAFAFRLFTGLFGHQKTGRACALHRNRGLLHLMTPICLVLLKRPSLLKKGCLCIFIPFGRVRAQRGFLSFLLGRHSNGIGVISPDADCSDTESKSTFITKTTIKRGSAVPSPFLLFTSTDFDCFSFPGENCGAGRHIFFHFSKNE